MGRILPDIVRVLAVSMLVATLIFAIGGVSGLGGFAEASKGKKEVSAKPYTVKDLKRTMDILAPLHKKLGKPREGDWLMHHKEAGQTFISYVKSTPVVPRKKRKVIYVQPIGDFTKAERQVVDATTEFIGHFYNLQVKVRKDVPLSVIPKRARRTHPTWGGKQVLTTYVLDKVLKPNLPKDAFACIALTSSDLWPGRGWNFVFGQASLRERVGVWSISRFGNPGESRKAFRLTLLRAMRTGTHELGHMFSMYHCTAYECGMCGSNSMTESDRRPLAFCPECMAKVCWATKTDASRRYEKLSAFCKKHGLEKEAKRYKKLGEALSPKKDKQGKQGKENNKAAASAGQG